MPEGKAKMSPGEKSTQSPQRLEETAPKRRALEDAFKIVSELKEENIQAHNLRTILNKMGVTLDDKEFEELLVKSGTKKGGTVNFNNFMAALDKQYHFSELTALQDAIQAIERIEGDKVSVEELPAFLRNMGIQLSDQEFRQALQKVSVDGHGKVVVKDFVKVLTNVPLFSDLLVLKDVIKAVSCIDGEKIFLQDLKPTLTKMGIHLTPLEYEEIIEMTPTDREGKLDIEQVMNEVLKTERFKEMEVLNNAIKTFGQYKDKVKLSEAKVCLSNIGVHFTEKELAEATKAVKFSADGTIGIKELMAAVKDTQRFANCVAVHDTIRALKLVKHCKQVKSRQRRFSLNTLGLRMANQVVAHVLKMAHVTETGQEKFNEFIRTLTRNQRFRRSSDLVEAFSILKKMKGSRIGVEDLKVVMKDFNINIPPEEISEALGFCTIDDEQTVNLKEFIKGVTHTSTFLVSPELQLTCLVLSKLKEDHFDLPALETTLKAMDLPEAKELLQEVMKTAKVNEQGQVDFTEFMRIFLLMPKVPEEEVLDETFRAMSVIKDNRVPVDEMATTLAKVGIHLTPPEVQELQSSLPVSEDGTVDFKDVVTKLTGTQSFAEFNAIQRAFSTISKICKVKIKTEDLPAALADVGISLSPEELQAAVTSATIDESGMLDGMELLRILADTPRAPEFVALQDAIMVAENIKNKNVALPQLKQTLENMGVHLTQSAFEILVGTVNVDENGEIDFRDFLLALGETPEFKELEALQRAIIMLGVTRGSHMHLNELESTLDDMGVHLNQEEIQEALHNIAVDADGTVNVKDFLKSLSQLRPFSDSKALHSAIETFSRIKGEKIKVSDLKAVMDHLDISLSGTELEEALKKITVDEDRNVNFKDFLVSVIENERFSEPAAIHHAYGVLNKVQDDKIEISELEDALDAIDITLTKEEMKEAVGQVTVDDEGKVDIKKFLSGLSSTRRFSQLAEIEQSLKTMKRIKEDTVNEDELETIMSTMDIHLAPAEVQQILQYVPQNADGTLSMDDIMSVLTKIRRFSDPEYDRVAIQDLKSVLESLGLRLTSEEMEQTLMHITVDEDGRVSLNDVIKTVKCPKRLSSTGGAPMGVVAVEHMNSLLSNIGINLTLEELEDVLSHLNVDENGKVNVNELMDYVLLTRTESRRKGKMLAADDLSPTLAKMGIHLTKKEMEEVLKHAPLDAEGKVNLKNVLKNITSTRRPSMFEKDRINIHDLEEIVANMGVDLTTEEFQEALKYASLDVNGKVNLAEFMKGVKAVQPHPRTGEMVAADDLGPTLSKMGIHLTEKEMEEVLKHVPLDAEGKVNLKNVLESIMAIRRPSMFEKDRIGLRHLEGIVANMGIHLTAEEFQEALKYAPLDVEGKVNLAELMKGIKAVQSRPRTGEKVSAENLGPALVKLGIHLTKKEMEEVLKHVPFDADGKVNLKSVLESIMEIRRPSMFEKDRINLRELEGILASMSIHLTAEEFQEALKYAPLDVDGKVNLGEFMKGVKAVQSKPRTEERKASLGEFMKEAKAAQPRPRTGEMVAADDLGPTLSKMGIHLTKKEMEEVLKHVSLDGEGKVTLKNVLESVMAIRQPSMFEKDRISLRDLEGILASTGIQLTAEEFQEALKYAPLDVEGKVNLAKFMKGVKAVQSRPKTGEMIAADDLSSALAKMGIHLTKKEMEEVLKRVPPDAEGKVNLKSVLDSIMATRRPSTFEKDRINLRELEGILARTGIHLTAKEFQEALKYAPSDVEGKVNLAEFMKGVRAVQSHPGTGEMVAADDLGPALAKMGVHLTKKEMEEVLKRVPLDAEGNVNLKTVLDSIMATRQPSMFEKDRISLRDLEGILASTGIHLTAEEFQEALKYAPLDVEGKVNLGEFLKGVEAVQPHPRTGEMVALDDLSPALAKMGIHLTKKEMEEVLKRVPLDAKGKVNLKSVLETIMATRQPSMFEKDRISLQDLEGILASMGIHLSAEEFQEALKYAPLDVEGKVNLAEFMKGAKAVLPPSMTENRISLRDLEGVLASAGIHLTAEEFQEALKYAPLDVEGKVNLAEFMKGAKAIQPRSRTGEMVAADDLSFAMAKMGVHLTKKELEEVLKRFPPDAEGKVNLTSVLESLKSTRRPSMLEKDRIGGQNLRGTLSSASFHLTPKELQEALKDAPLDGEMVAADDLSSSLAKMGIHLTKEEMEEVLKHVPVDDEGKVNLKSVLEYIMTTRRPSMFEKDRIDVQALEGILASAGIHLTAEELQEALKYAPLDADGKLNLGKFMKGVRAVQAHPRTEEEKVTLGKFMTGTRTVHPQARTRKMIAADDLSPTLAKMGIHLTKDELEEVLKHVPPDARGKVNLKSVLESIMATRQPSMFEKDRIDISDLESILTTMGIYLTAEEQLAVLKYAPLDEEGKVNLAEFMKGVKAVQPHPRTEARVDIDSLGAVLAEMGIHLTNKQLYEALKHTPIDADGKVDLEAFKRGVRAVLRTEKKVAVGNLESILADIGIHLTQEEMQQALKLAMVDEDGMVNLKDFMWAAQTIPSIQDKKLKLSDLNSVLDSLGIYLTHEELHESLKLAKLNEDGTVNLSDLIRACNAILTLPSTRTRYLSQTPDVKMLKLPKVTGNDQPQSVHRIFSSSSTSANTRLRTVRILTTPQLEAFRTAYDSFCKDLDGMIDLAALEATADNLGISLTEEEAFEELVYADTDGDGRVNFTDFLNIVTNSKRFVQAVAPKKGSLESVDARGILFFELLSKLVETSALPGKTITAIVSFYRQKFLESTGKKVWPADDTKHRWRKKGSPSGTKEPSSLAAFAGAGRIMVMKDKELETFVKTLHETSAPSDSPYAQIPVFPLIPNRDCVMTGRPKKDVHKLEGQRMMEPISSFQNHFFHKKRWMPESKPPKSPRPSLTLAPDLVSRGRRLTINNLDEIRREVKKATENYRKALAMRERNKSLKLWRRLRGGEIGLETGNPSFYQTFSTYSWSWNVCQELLTPEELQAYDSRLYHNVSRSGTPVDKLNKADRRQRGHKK